MIHQVNNLQMVAICHWALQDMNPGINLVELVKAIKEESSHLPDAMELYDSLRERFRMGFGRLPREIRGNFQEVLDNQRRAGEDDALYCVYAWYRCKVLRLLDLITDPGRRFPLDTALCDPEQPLAALYAEVPIPIIETYDNAGYSYGVFDESSSSSYFLRSLARITNQLWNGATPEVECPWWDICGQSEIAFRDEKCRATPWITCIQRPCCPYGTAAAYLRLNDRSTFTPNPEWTTN